MSDKPDLMVAKKEYFKWIAKKSSDIRADIVAILNDDSIPDSATIEITPETVRVIGEQG